MAATVSWVRVVEGLPSVLFSILAEESDSRGRYRRMRSLREAVYLCGARPQLDSTKPQNPIL